MDICYSMATLLHGRTDWERVDRLTDEEIDAAVTADPDARLTTDEAFWADAELVLPPDPKTLVLP